MEANQVIRKQPKTVKPQDFVILQHRDTGTLMLVHRGWLKK